MNMREWAEHVRPRLSSLRHSPAREHEIEVTLGGSFLAWTLYSEGRAATRLREDLDTALRPYLARGAQRRHLTP
jgi:hypothetical protein